VTRAALRRWSIAAIGLALVVGGGYVLGAQLIEQRHRPALAPSGELAGLLAIAAILLGGLLLAIGTATWRSAPRGA
jgi:hypothetical protein